MTIQFRDRPLKKGEKSHYYCDKCGMELHEDLAYSHKCSKLKVIEIDFTKKMADDLNEIARKLGFEEKWKPEKLKCLYG